MSDLPSWRLLLAGLIVAAWIIAAAATVLLALSAGRRRRRSVAGDAPGVADLPLTHALIETSGRLRVAPSTLDLFAVDAAASLRDLATGQTGLRDKDLELLEGDAEQLLEAGQTFKRVVRTRGGEPILVDGWRFPAPAGEAAGVLWFRDMAEVRGGWFEREQRLAELEKEVTAARALLAAMPGPIWRRDSQLRLVQVNQAYVSAVDAPDAEAVIAGQIELDTNLLGPSARAAARHVQSSGITRRRLESVIIGGARRMMEIVEVPLPGGEIASYSRDLTEEVEARSELKRITETQTAAFDRLSCGIARFNADGTLVFLNERFATLFGLDRRWLDEQQDLDGLLDRLHETRRLPEQANYPAWRTERRGWLRDPEPAEETWALHDGSVFRVMPQPHPGGGLLLLVEDRTEQLHLESARQTLARVQQATIEQLHEALAVFGADGRLRLYNHRFAHVCALPPAALEGEPHAEALMNRIAAVLKEPERVYGLRDLIFTATTLRQARSGRVSGSGPGGRTMDYRAVPLPDGNAMLLFLDVTDTQRLEQTLAERDAAYRAAEKVQHPFIESVLEGLAAPVAVLRAGVRQAGDDDRPDVPGADARKPREALAAAAEQLERLADDLRDLSSPPDEFGEPETGRVDVVRVLRKLLDDLEASTPASRRRLDSRLDPAAASIDADENRLRQAIRHLICDTLRAAAPEVHLRLEAAGSPESVTLTLRILNGEMSAPARLGDDVRGGLGMMLARRFVGRHGGRLEVEEERSGASISLHLFRRRAEGSARLIA